MNRKTLGWPQIAARVSAAIFGCYAFTWGFAAASVAALVSLDVAYHDAEMGVLMFAFMLFPALFLWSFVATSITRVWAMLAVGAALLFTAAWVIQRALLA